MQVNGHPFSITLTREIWKLQVGLNVEDRVLIYNRSRSHGQEFRDQKARYLIERFGLSKWDKRKTYVFGRWLPNTKTIQLEAEGELPESQRPDW